MNVFSPLMTSPPAQAANTAFSHSMPAGLSGVPNPQAALRSADGSISLDRDTLFAEFAPLVRRLVYQYAKDHELRQDMPGEIYFRFCALLDAYDPGRNIPLRAYLVRQLSASIYTFARHRWRQQVREVTTEDIAIFCPDQAEDPTGAWDDALVMQDFSRELPALLTKLPPRQAQVVIWRYYDEASFEEIGERLCVKPATARSLLRHGLNHLRRLFAETSLLAQDVA